MNEKANSYTRVYDKETNVLLYKLVGPEGVNSDDKPTVSGTQTSKAYFLEIRLPGITEKNLEVHYDNGTLTIQTTPYEVNVGTQKGRVISFSTSEKKDTSAMKPKTKPFRKIYRLPKDADPRGISALFCDGVLSLEISKKLNAS